MNSSFFRSHFPFRAVRSTRLARPGLVFLALAAGGWLRAQTSASPAPDSSAPRPDETVVLDPFDVTSKPTKGYLATNTISGTAMNTPLKEVPMSINVITSEFLDDSLVGTTMAHAFDFNASITQTNRQPVANRQASFAIRGFRTRNTLIDGVQGGEYVPTLLIDRIEVVKGPNTLYGQSDPGGLINIITKQPTGVNGVTLTQKAGNYSTYETDVDANANLPDQKLKLRLLGSHSETNGWFVVDGSTSNVAGLTGNYDLTKKTEVVFEFSGSETTGVPTQRSNIPFNTIPTDLNGDGDTKDTVGGVPEANARYNSTFVPSNFTSATRANHYDQKNYYAEFGVRQTITDNLRLQYSFMRTDQSLNLDFRAFNTFSAAGSADANYTWSNDYDRTDAHTLNAFFNLSTGPIQHRLLAGVRHTHDQSTDEAYALRALQATERPKLDALIASGRNIRLFLTKADLASGVKYWQEDVPTVAELKSLGSRIANVTDGVGSTDTKITTFYVTDSMAMLNDRLKILAGVRNIRIDSTSANYTGVKIGSDNDQHDTSFQLGGNFDITSQLTAFANYATAFNPNGLNPATNSFFEPERSKAYEAGFKLDGLWHGKISGTVSYFHILKKNVVASDYNPVTFKNDTDITDDESKGFEAELFIAPVESWQTVISYAHTDAKVVKSITAAQGLGLEGAAPQRLTIWTSYGLERGMFKGLRFGGGLIWAQGPIQQFGVSNNRYIFENGYTVIDLFARYGTRIFARPVSFGFNIDNLNNVIYFRSRGATSSPRQVVFSVRVEL